MREILAETCRDEALQARLVAAFDFGDLLDRSFRKLSSGETRKVLLIRAFASAPQLLVAVDDEPFPLRTVSHLVFLKLQGHIPVHQRIDIEEPRA